MSLRPVARAVCALAVAGLSGCPPAPGPGDGGPGGAGGSDGGGGGAGGGGALAPAQNRSGTRLKARWATNAEGLKLFSAWYDSARGAECGFQPAADGEWRCLPSVTLGAYTAAFADPACTQAVAIQYSSSCATPSVISTDDDAHCPSRARIYELGAQLTAATYYVKHGASCDQVMVGAGNKVWRFGAEVPAASFIRATEVSGADAGAVRALWLEGEDGSRYFHALRLAATGQKCWAFAAKDLQLRCLPNDNDVASLSGSFADAACTTPVATSYNPSCLAPTTALGFDRATCPTTAVVYPVAGAASSLYSSQSGTCAATTPSAGTSNYALGSETPAASYPLTPRVDGATHGRLQVRLYDFGQGTFRVAGLNDTTLATVCWPGRDGSGHLRCIPSTEGLAEYYSDAACAQLLGSHHAPAGCAPTYAAAYDYGVCPHGLRFWHMGAAYSGATYYRSGTACMPVTLGPHVKLAQLGAEVLPAELAPLTEVTDP